MLILRRKQNEGFHIGRDIHVRILESAAGRVSIGIDAPDDLKILRDELIEHEEVPRAQDKT